MVPSNIFATWILIFITFWQGNFINARDASYKNDLCDRFPNLRYCQPGFTSRPNKQPSNQQRFETTTSLITIPFADEKFPTRPPIKTTPKNDDNPSKYCWTNLKSHQYFCLGPGSEDPKAKNFCPSYESDCNLVPSPAEDEPLQPTFFAEANSNSGLSTDAKTVKPIDPIKTNLPDPRYQTWYCSQYRPLFLQLCDPQTRPVATDVVKFCKQYSSFC